MAAVWANTEIFAIRHVVTDVRKMCVNSLVGIAHSAVSLGTQVLNVTSFVEIVAPMTVVQTVRMASVIKQQSHAYLAATLDGSEQFARTFVAISVLGEYVDRLTDSV